MNEDDTFAALRRVSLTKLKVLHQQFMDNNPHITLKMSREFFIGHGWDRAEYIIATYQDE